MTGVFVGALLVASGVAVRVALHAIAVITNKGG